MNAKDMDELLSKGLLTSPDLLRKTLSSRGVKDPLREAFLLNALLGTDTLAGLAGRDLLNSLEAMWPSVADLLTLIERKITSSPTPNGSVEKELLAAHSELSFCLLGAYRRAIEELGQRRKLLWGISHQLVALSRAADILIRIGLLRRQLYMRLPGGFWLGFHTLLQVAEKENWLTKHLPTEETGERESSLAERYISFALLDIVSPDGLPAHEIRPLYTCFLHFSEHSGFQLADRSKSSSKALLHVDLSRDAPPFLDIGHETFNPESERQIDPLPTIQKIERLLNSNSSDHLYVDQCSVMLSRATLDRTHQRLLVRAKRKQTRHGATGMVCLWCGRTNMVKRLQQRDESPGETPFCKATQGALSETGHPWGTHPLHLDQPGIDSPPQETLRIKPLEHNASSGELW